jgi:hypothetical protein
MNIVNKKTINPLYGITIGSTVSSLNGEFKAGVVTEPVSVMHSQIETYKSMSGESSYVYSDMMNQGSFGMSGSYGVAGVSKLKSSLSAYVGNSSASSSKSVNVNYNALSVAGVEYIDFGMLTASDFLASLDKATQQNAILVLDAYNAVIQEAEKLDIDLRNPPSEDSPAYQELKPYIGHWVSLSELFVQNFGDGLVVGVAWGAFGSVTMEITSESQANSWEYGGQADFSYAGVGSSVAVKATYDGSNSSNYADVKVACTSYVSGSILVPQIDKWLDQVINKTFAELADVKVMELAPNMTITQGAPVIPEFEKPQPSSSITSKVGEIKDLNGLQALAKASAYDRAKKTDPNLSLDDFLKQSEEPAYTEKLEELRKAVSENEIDTLGIIDKASQVPGLAKSSMNKPANTVQLSSSANADLSDYVPLGVWISNWADLLPWMAQGYYNSIEHLDGIEQLRERVMLQDFQALARLYYTADSSGITSIKRVDRTLPNIETLDIGNSFAHAAAILQENSGNVEEVKKIVRGLGNSAEAIYRFWNKHPFLRDAELAFGLIRNLEENGKVISKSINSIEGGGSETSQPYSLTPCPFNPEDGNYTAFTKYYKVLSLITPDEEVWAFGPEQGGLSAIYDHEAIFTKPGRAKYIKFTCDNDNKVLKHEDLNIVLYPIPFSAAENVNWKGMSASSNVASVSGLNQSLASLNKQLNELNAWTFSSDRWNTGWNGETYYIQKQVKKHYVGLIDEIKTVL